ncbi:VanZ family protein (plasmid) [Clostridium estertheticum]|uniref:VanZ family protein n=1 Tax=Clostridium estertheticum TaxID=238834 RepID=UPI001C7D1FD9|nr:VanZ family protein [Clostridium estertheticum]MBX4262831.1 VanZ family protein [Clostridium estertheticum]WLC73125.1 VanZ family protein [Clostridium estertheticum]
MDKIDKYIKKVINGLDLDKKEIDELKTQFKDHIFSLKAEYLEKSYSDDKAIDLALEDFGNENNISEMFDNNETMFFSTYKKVMLVLFCTYLFFLCAYLINLSNFELPKLRFNIINIIPFRTIISIIKAILAYGLNINTLMIPYQCLFFIPMGVFIPLINYKANSFKYAIKIFTLIVLLIQVVKFVVGMGRGNIDFAIFQLLGCLIGYGIYKILMKSKILKKFISVLHY